MIFQPANQVAPCSPYRTIPLPQATFTVLLWDGGTLRFPCPNKSYTVMLTKLDTEIEIDLDRYSYPQLAGRILTNPTKVLIFLSHITLLPHEHSFVQEVRGE
ncbi:hypothetical protein TNCV_748801 [Trichonephila clavipes]|nr:hypothetical protein TNCV_748801 [Trichonephila clavipes]